MADVLRIAFVTSCPIDAAGGGSAVYAFHVLKEVSPDLEVHVFAPGIQVGWSKVLEERGILFHHVGAQWGRKFGLIPFWGALHQSITRMLRGGLKLDLIHSNDISAAVLLIGKLDVPVIATVHHVKREAIVSAPLPPLYRMSRVNEEVGIAAALEPFFLRRCAGLIAVSQRTKRSLVADYGISEEEISVIHNGIDSSFMAAEGENSRPAANGIHDILWIGRPEPRKGLELALRVFAGLAPMCESNLEIVSASMPRSSIKYLAGQGLNNRLRWHSSIPQDLLIKLYSRSHLYLQTSYVEGFSLTLAEAIAAGCRIVATKTGAAEELLRDGRYGRLVSPGDEEGLLSACLSELRLPPLDENQKKERQRFLVENFSWAEAASMTEVSYRQVVDRMANS